MKSGKKIEDFVIPPHPKGLTLENSLVSLQPLSSKLHSDDLFKANSLDKKGKNWLYLSYGPFNSKNEYAKWIKSFEDHNDPVFFAIIRKKDDRAIGVASYLRIKLAVGSIEVGHINYSPLLQNTIQGTAAMYLMMKWAFENGYRRYEWKCNALNVKSRKAAQRLGFSYEGVFRQAGISKGKNRDTAWFATIDNEWGRLEECFLKYFSENNDGYQRAPLVSLSSLTRPLLYKIDTFEFC